MVLSLHPIWHFLSVSLKLTVLFYVCYEGFVILIKVLANHIMLIVSMMQ